MKLNLLFAGSDIIPGYLNIDPIDNNLSHQAFSEEKIIGDIRNLSQFVTEPVEHIVVNYVLSYFNLLEGRNMLEHWLSLTNHITINNVDFREITKAYTYGNISTQDVNVMIYGDNQPFLEPKSVWSLTSIIDILEGFDFTITDCRVSNYRFSVTGEK